MKRDFLEYFPIVVVILFIASFFVIYVRGGFNETKNLSAPSLIVTPTPIPTSTPIVTPTSTPTPNLVPLLLPAGTPIPLGTIPSIIRRGGDDD